MKLAALAAVWFAAAVPPAIAQRYTADIVSYSTNDFLVNTWVPLTVRVKNTGIQNRLTVRAAALPYGWQILADEGGHPTEVTKLVPAGDTASFKFRILSYEYQVQGTITWEVWETTLEGFPIRAAQEFQGVKAVFPPSSFRLVSPYSNQPDVPTPPTFQWQASGGADSYRVELFHDANGEAAPEPFYTSKSLTTTLLAYDGSEFLPYGEPYWWQVKAKNAYAETTNEEGKSFFSVKPLPMLGSFTITGPVYDGRYLTLPAVQWTASALATRYEVKVYDDVAGQPAASPLFRISDVTGTYWNWTGAYVPPGKHYWVSVTAYGESVWVGKKEASNSPLRFEYSTINPFSLTSPYFSATAVPLQPRFQWERPYGAQSFRIEIRGTSDYPNSGFLFTDTCTDSTYQYAGPLLTPKVRYEWTVYGVNAQEERMAEGEYSAFHTVDIQPFLLDRPVHGATGVPYRPLFTWHPVHGDHVNEIILEVWKDHDTQVGAKQMVYESLTPLPRTATSKEYDGVNLEAGRAYYWRVLARNAYGNGRYNEGGFRPFRATSASTFLIREPWDRTIDKPANPLFEWSESPNADRYSLMIWLTGEDHLPRNYPIAVIHNIQGLQYQYPDPPKTLTENLASELPLLTPNTEFAWEVYAWKRDDWVGASNQPFRFTTKAKEYWFGIGLPEVLLGKGKLTGAAGTVADENGDDVLDIADLVNWLRY